MSNSLRHSQSVSQSDCTLLHSHKQCTRVSGSVMSLPTLNANSLFSSISSGGDIKVSHCGFCMQSPMTNDSKYLSVCLLESHVSLLKYLFKSFAHFKKLYMFMIQNTLVPWFTDLIRFTLLGKMATVVFVTWWGVRKRKQNSAESFCSQTKLLTNRSVHEPKYYHNYICFGKMFVCSPLRLLLAIGFS